MNFVIDNFGTCTWDKQFSVKGPLSQSNVYIYTYMDLFKQSNTQSLMSA